MTSEVKLPEPHFPEGVIMLDESGQPTNYAHADMFTAAQMEAYARAAVEANRGEAAEGGPANLGEFVIALLIAGGYVTEAKVTEARKIALSHGPYEMQPESGGQGEAVGYFRRITNDSGYQSKWEFVALDVEREARIGRWNCEYKPLYTHPPASVAVTGALSNAELAEAIAWASNRVREVGHAEAQHPLLVKHVTGLLSEQMRRAALSQGGREFESDNGSEFR